MRPFLDKIFREIEDAAKGRNTGIRLDNANWPLNPRITRTLELKGFKVSEHEGPQWEPYHEWEISW